MKKITFLIFAFGLLLISCNNSNDPEPTLPTPNLNYDGPNQSAPLLDPGNYEAAVRFTSAETSPFANRNLTSIQFFVQDAPALCVIAVYGEGSPGEPGNLLYEQEVTNGVTAGTWNQYNFTTPIPITGEDLWLSIIVEHDRRMASIGCDPGPAVANGDWLWVDDQNDWITLREHTNQAVNINWNIRGFVN